MGGGGSKSSESPECPKCLECPKCPECPKEVLSTKPGLGDSCPNGKVISKDRTTNKKTCEPLTCPPDTTVKADSKGTIGCADKSGNVLICPYNSPYWKTFEGDLVCSPFNQNNSDIYITDNNNNCPVGYSQVPNNDSGTSKCQQGESSAGMGDIVAMINQRNFKGIGGDLAGGGKCPSGFYMYADIDGGIGCTNKPGEVIICPTGYSYATGNNNTATCILNNKYTGPAGACLNGYLSFNDSNGNPVCRARDGFTSNVYDFKSKRDRNVENFSQNNNKCKARY